MSANCDVLKKYYEGWETGEFDRDLFTDDFTFTGPLMSAESADEYLMMITEMASVVTISNLDFKGRFMNNDSSQACAIYDFETSAPAEISTVCAEMFNLEDGKIKSIQLIFDPRQWIEVFGEG